ncbi:hypothetical protein Patl1_28136 [Pistacia atlantica]|uniref:Uncharacterized protein n=1 Tax=Pistacia atlantica TaxID=434234 RepID=A0ACC1BET0_9ROSI|nr:hypothetical protein Patl1_28136 [Pistacia atlantica]
MRSLIIMYALILIYFYIKYRRQAMKIVTLFVTSSIISWTCKQNLIFSQSNWNLKEEILGLYH